MAGAEIGNIIGEWVSGALHLRDTLHQDLIVFSSTGIGYGGSFAAYGAQTTTCVAATTLTHAHCGKLVLTTTDGVAFTLPAASTEMAGTTYTIINLASSGGAVITVSTSDAAEYIIGNGKVSTDACTKVTNTAITQVYGDQITIVNSGAVLWVLSSVVGTWALA